MTVIEADNGEDAIRLFALEKPDLLFLDVEMPAKNGFEVCEAIRAMSFGSTVPIMLATGAEDKASIDRGFSVGATQYKTKPINWSLLSRDIRYMLRAAEAFIELKAQEDRLRYLAYYDHLTDLPNRRSFLESLKSSLERSAQHDDRTGLIFVNIDHFKRINDSIGHERGDQLLKQIAERLLASLARIAPVLPNSEADAIRADSGHMVIELTRPGGDEFGLVIHALRDEATLVAVGQALLDALDEPLQVERHQLVISPSVGLAIAPDHGDDPQTLLRRADTAMRAAKSDGRGRMRLYNESMDDDAAERLRLEADLRRALENDEQLNMVYQPQIDTQNGRVSGVEALVRWNHPELGPVSPVKFIPVAESSGLIIPLGDWILRRVNRDALSAGQRFPTNVAISINLSPLQFTQSNFVENLQHILAELELDYRVELELTEGVIMSDAQDSLEKLKQLKTLGFDLAIDDFGTGYSSLSYLRNFPIDTLKIDRSFVINIGTHDGDGIVKAILGLSQALGLKTVAEGVETVEQATFLCEHGCSSLQGYLFARPLSVPALLDAVGQDYLPLMKCDPEVTTSSAD